MNRAAVLLFVTVGMLLLSVSCGGAGESTTPTTPPTSPPATDPAAPPRLKLTSFVTGLTMPLGLESPNDGSGRLFALEQGGAIRIIRGGSVVTPPFLDISAKLAAGGETGLLGLAFHPDFAQSGKLYVNYTRTAGGQLQSVIAEYLVQAGNADQVDTASERILLTVDQPATNHNGGQLAFGPDGFLYIALGDGGGSGDPQGNGQNPDTLLGTVLRIDVNTTGAGQEYGIPADNPFAGGGGRPEIYAYGFRNPWRFSFDAPSGRAFVADVGQSAWEEIDLLQRGGNFGWNVMEGAHCFNPPNGCDSSGLVLPITEYGRADGGTVIGGFVYQGTAIADLVNTYVFGDFLSGNIWGLQQLTDGTWRRTTLATTGRNISSFGRDESGELYVVDYSGEVLRVERQ